MTPGEQHTADTAQAAIKLLDEEGRTAVLAWVDDRERAARLEGARNAATLAYIIVALRITGAVFGAFLAAFLVFSLLFGKPKGYDRVCPEPLACEVCATPVGLEWETIMPRNNNRYLDTVHYADAGAQECVAVGDAVLCAPKRVPATAPPQTQGGTP